MTEVSVAQPDNFPIASGGSELLDRVEPLWHQLRHHHAELAPRWRDGLLGISFEQRRTSLLAKSSGGLLVLLASDRDSDIAYCLVSISAENRGEVDSLYVTPSYRRRRIGDALMAKTMEWLGTKAVRSVAVEVISGNEEALRFYERYGFAPRTVRLLRTAAGM